GSHLDWTAATASRHFGNVVEWPESKFLYDRGFKDAYRVVHPNPITHPGFTWPFHVPGPNWPRWPIRIDYIYYKGSALIPTDSYIVGEANKQFPSNHGAVFTTFKYLR